MLESIALVLIAVWLVGLLVTNPVGGLIHVLLFLAAVVILVRIMKGRRHE